MNIHFIFIKLGWKTQSYYRANIIGFLISSLFLYSVRILFIDVLFDYTDFLASWPKNNVICLIVFSIIISLSSAPFYSSIRVFFSYVAAGKIEPYLTRPVSFVHLLLTRWSTPIAYIILLFTILFFLILNIQFKYIDLQEIELYRYLLVIFSIILGVGGNMAILTAIHSITFLIQRNVDAEYVYAEIYRFSQVPPELVTSRFFITSLFLFPVLLSSSAPTGILLGNYDYFFLQLIVCPVFIILSFILFRECYKRFVSLGG